VKTRRLSERGRSNPDSSAWPSSFRASQLVVRVDFCKNHFPSQGFLVGAPVDHLVNTCAVRLSDAITRVDPGFFRAVSAGSTWHEPIRSGGRYLPVNAGRLARALTARLGHPRLVSNLKPLEVVTGSSFSIRFISTQADTDGNPALAATFRSGTEEESWTAWSSSIELTASCSGSSGRH
jgi:hypothetical protein